LTSTVEFSALLDKKADLEKQIKEEAKEVFANSAKEIFEKYGDKVGCFKWSQYTPYFNDGEPCEFGKHDVWIFTPKDMKNGDMRYEEGSAEFYGGYGETDTLSKTLYRHDRGHVTSGHWLSKEKLESEYEAFENPNFDPEYGEPYTAIHDLCDLIDEDTALALFGDHVEVIVTADGVSVEEYDHD
jgi:hypothetical protein